VIILSQGSSSEASQQFKCEVCGRIFNDQNELDDHTKSVHTSYVASQNQSARGMSSSSSSSSARWSGQGVNYSSENTQTGNENKKETSTTSGEGSSRTWDEATKEELKTMDQQKVEGTENSGGSDREMSSAYREQTGRGGETAVRGEEQVRQAAQNEVKCQHCGQIFASQADLDRHNKNIHGIDTESDMGKRGQPQETTAT